MRFVITIVLLLLAVVGVAYVFMGGDGSDAEAPGGEAATMETGDGLPADGVIVYYFHGTKRCPTCNKMENLASAVINVRFAADVAAGSVVFVPTNVETDANRHFVEDFSLTTKTVVMVERRGGQDRDWRRLDEVWDKIGQDDVYRDYIAENLTLCLDNQQKDAG